jgi:catechol 2,3-dioxygenase-like lactoylglutathione lyase family enzyme
MSEGSFPIITVRDLPAARDFYARLGFVQTYQFPPQGDAGFVTLERNSSTIGLSAGGDESDDRFAYWVYVDDVDAVFEDVRASETPIVGAPKDEPWGERVAHLRDPDGNLVHLGAAIPQ